MKKQNPNSKRHKNSKNQSPRPGTSGLEFRVWNFFGVWSLEFGVFRLLAFVLLLFVLSGSPVSAQTNTAKPAPHSHRYLLVVEVSHSMERRSDAVLRVVQ